MGTPPADLHRPASAPFDATRRDVVVVGGGIIGLAVARELTRRRPGASITLVEKEDTLASHQTGRNSGVIHSGIYYAPGSLKARLCAAGSRSMVAFAQEYGVAHDVCGKLIVATDDAERAGLDRLFRRGLENGLAVAKIGPAEAAEIEPHVACVEAVRVPSTGIIDYLGVCRALADAATAAGAEVVTGVAATGFRQTAGGRVVETTNGDLHARFVVTCGGLQSDRLARQSGADPGARIVPFRGEYYELAPDRTDLVRTLVYPVPDPDFPFLGVHFTRMIDGNVHAGPNAVLALEREGYRWRDVAVGDLVETLTYPGFLRLARRHWRAGAMEMRRSLSKAAFTRSLQRLVPAITEADLVPSPAGVRAQALKPDGGLVDDFPLVEQDGALHVCNAPSPAATASLEIARVVCDRIG